MVGRDRPWLENYEDAVPADIDLKAVPTMAARMARQFTDYADRPAVTCLGVTKTYAELQALSDAYGAYLSEAVGHKAGDRVAVMLPNLFSFPIAMCAHIRLGLVQVNVNPLYTPRELQHQLNDAGAETIVIFEASLPTLEAIIGDTPVKRVIIASPTSVLAPTGTPAKAIDGVETISLDEILADYAGKSITVADVSGDDLVFLQYTGGTTGLSKGAMLSHFNVSSNIDQTLAFFGDHITDEGEVVITALPLYHIFALTVNMLGQMELGSHNVLIPNPTDMPGFVAEIKKWPFTFFTGVNTLYNGLVNTPGFDEVDFSTLKFAMGGGAPVQEAVSNKWKGLSGRHIVEGYGLSETSPVLTTNPLGQSDFKSSIGVPIPSTLISIRDDAGNEVPRGEPGELCAYGPQVMKGYWNLPEKTDEVFTEDGYFRTGDVAVEDPGGFFRIVDRKKDMILVSGFNVFPNEIEDVVARMDKVLECACVGVPHEKTGEAARLFVVLQPGQDCDEDTVRAFCKEHLTGYKVPKTVTFIDALPKSTVGKILRRELRDQAVAGKI